MRKLRPFNKNQIGLNFEQLQRILKYVFQTALNLGLDQSGVIF
jgi:hypothetical protein